jgi:hypothetical protein
MEILMVLVFFAALLGIGYWLAVRKGKAESETPPDGHVPKLPDDYDGSDGWFGSKPRKSEPLRKDE